MANDEKIPWVPNTPFLNNHPQYDVYTWFANRLIAWEQFQISSSFEVMVSNNFIIRRNEQLETGH